MYILISGYMHTSSCYDHTVNDTRNSTVSNSSHATSRFGGRLSESIRRFAGGSHAGSSLDRTTSPVVLGGTRLRIWYDVELAAVAEYVATWCLNSIILVLQWGSGLSPGSCVVSVCRGPDLGVVW